MSLAALKDLLGIEGNPITWMLEQMAGGMAAKGVGCRVWNNDAGAIGYTSPGDPLLIPWTHNAFDTHNLHDISGGPNTKITIPSYDLVPRGIWLIHAHLSLTSLQDPQASGLGVNIEKNGLGVSFANVQDIFHHVQAGITDYAFNVSGLWIPEEGDYFETKVVLSQGADVYVEMQERPVHSFFEAVFLGATTTPIMTWPVP